jgi:hypothetical protein
VERPQLQGAARSRDSGTGADLAQGNLSQIQVLRQTGELQFHLHQADERGLRGVHQGIRQGAGHHQPLQHRAEFRPYRPHEGGDAECMRLCHVIQL